MLCVLPAIHGAAQLADAGGASEQGVSLEISDMDVAEAMQWLADATQFNIILSSKVEGKITAYILDMEPERALREVIEVNGFHYVKADDVVWVLSDEEYYEDRNLGRVRRVIPLRHARATVLAAMLPDALSKNAIVLAYPDTNVVVIAESEDRIDEAVELVAELDVPPRTRVFQLSHATASDMIALLQPHVATQDSLRADVRTNQVMISGTDEMLDRLGALLMEFDKPDKVSTRVFHLRYANADETAELLREVLTGRKQSATSGAYSSDASTGEGAPKVFTTEPSRPAAATPALSWNAYRERSAPGQGRAPARVPAAGEPAQPGMASGEQATAQAGDEALALGPLASVASDPRTNAVIITHIESVLERLATIIESIDVPGQYHTYQFKNVDPAELELESKLIGLLPVEDPYLQVDATSRKVTFRAPADKAQELTALLREWDTMVRQVRIEAEILRVNVTFLKKLGVQWQAVKLDRGGFNRVNVDMTFPASIADDDSVGELTIGDLDDADYFAVLQALREDNDTEVIATPSILARDNNEAVFTSARDEPYTVVTVDGNTQTTLEDVRFLNVGVTLMVAPQIHKDDVITLDTQLEISQLVEIREGIPVVDRATAQSSISVRNSGTVVLGGLRQRSRSQFNQGLPLISKIPLLGALFRNKRDSKEESEIILILRPQIVGDHQDDAPLIEDMRGEMGAAIKEEKLGQDLGIGERLLDGELP
ncbi:MAG: hypothetical protein JXR94_20130 [Candidatus Hydrogenedentes bacterium]|nr:hypothetical protein [Candidatus Hydrogenedentota bacterium]